MVPSFIGFLSRVAAKSAANLSIRTTVPERLITRPRKRHRPVGHGALAMPRTGDGRVMTA
jgi:hypothetical protein